METERETTTTSNNQVVILEEKNKKLLLEIEEITRHLSTAEAYIQQNTEEWEKSKEALNLLVEREESIKMLKKNLEISRKQNNELE